MTHCSRTMILTIVLLGTAVAASQAQSASNPACGLLTGAELQKITGKAYDEGDEGDAMGEGAGGGASCQWGDPVGRGAPMVSVVYIPSKGGKGYTEINRASKMLPGCKREPVSGLGDEAHIETCSKGRGPVAYIKAGANDLIVQMDAIAPATALSVKPTLIAVAKAVVARAR
jgi:hypothetical protein